MASSTPFKPKQKGGPQIKTVTQLKRMVLKQRSIPMGYRYPRPTDSGLFRLQDHASVSKLHEPVPRSILYGSRCHVPKLAPSHPIPISSILPDREYHEKSDARQG